MAAGTISMYDPIYILIYLEDVWWDLSGQYKVLENIKKVQWLCCSQQQPAGVRTELEFPQEKDGWQLGYLDFKTIIFVLLLFSEPLCTYLDRDFILKRQKELQDYISQVLENTELASNINTQTFFDPENYMINFPGVDCHY